MFPLRFTYLVASFLWVGATGPASVLAAPGAPQETARAHHEQGRVSVANGRYEAAIAEYRRAYELKADPSFLYDIAEAYRGLGVPDRAVFFYRRYLSTHTNPPNRPEVESQIAQLDPEAAAGKPRGRRWPRRSRRCQRRRALAMAPWRPWSRSPAVHSISDQERSVVGRWWFWTAVGALAAAGATVAILAATRDNGDGNDIPSTPLGNARIDF